jgi:DNA primase
MRLGFALNKWDSLLNYLKSRGINPGLINRLGLTIANEEGGFYDRFRNRIIFPIFDVKSNVIGFGGRVLDNDTTPKYTNSPETPVYIKGKNLYGLNFSKDAIREEDLCLIVEGYLDFLIPFSSGIKNIVASLGTALTPEQIRLIKRYTQNVTIIYDSDTAGELATLRSLDLFIEEGMNIKVVELERGYDPDLFVREFGPDSLKKRIKDAKGIFDYKLDFLRSRYDVKKIEQKAKIIDEMLVSINKFHNAVVRADYMKRLSEELNVHESAVVLEANRIRRQFQPRNENVNLTESKREILYNNLKRDSRAFEQLLVRLMLEEEELIAKIRESVSASDFQDKNLSQIVQTMFEMSQLGKSITPNKLLAHFQDSEISSLISGLAAKNETIEDKEKVIEECIMRIKRESVKAERLKLCEAIKQAQTLKNEEQLVYLLHKFNDLAKKEVGL